MTIIPLSESILKSIKVYHKRSESEMKKIRKSRGLTQQQIANRTHLSVTTISNYELGNKMIPDDHRIQIAKILRCDPSDF